MKKHSLIRTVYLYLFALVGLTLMVIGGVSLINLGLKMFVFKKAEVENIEQPPLVYLGPERTVKEENFIETVEKCQEKCELTEEQKEQMESWLRDYKSWQEQRSKIDYRTQTRHRDAARAFSFIIIGLPLYLYHWAVIKKELKVRSEV